MFLERQRLKFIVFLVIAAVLWSTGGFLIKLVNWPPLAIAGARSLIAALVIGLAFRHEALSWSRVQIFGAIAYCGMVTLFVTATKLTTAANAILLQYTAPIYVALLSSWLLNEKTSGKDWLTILFTLGGMIFFFIDRVSAGGMLGNVCGIASGISFALFAIMMRKQKDGSPFGSVFLGNIFTFILGIPALTGAAFTLENCVGILLLGVFQLGVAYVFYSIAIKHVLALEATLITTLEPILNPVWVFLLVGEKPGVYSLIGGLIVLTAISARYILQAVDTKR